MEQDLITCTDKIKEYDEETKTLKAEVKRLREQNEELKLVIEQGKKDKSQLFEKLRHELREAE